VRGAKNMKDTNHKQTTGEKNMKKVKRICIRITEKDRVMIDALEKSGNNVSPTEIWRTELKSRYFALIRDDVAYLESSDD